MKANGEWPGNDAPPQEVVDDKADLLPERGNLAIVEASRRAELLTQVDVAKAHPRSIAKSRLALLTAATITQDVAASCLFALPRAGKTIEGPSVRLAELAVFAWGNITTATRAIAVLHAVVVAEGVAYDYESNVCHREEVRRKILDKYGKRFSFDMIEMTMAAAKSVALRNAIFRVIPRAYVDPIYRQIARVAVGSEKELGERRTVALATFKTKWGIDQARVFAALGVKGVEDITLNHMATLTGAFTALRDGTNPDEVFPPTPLTDLPSGKRIGFGPRRATVPAPVEPAPEPEPASVEAAAPEPPDPKLAPIRDYLSNVDAALASGDLDKAQVCLIDAVNKLSAKERRDVTRDIWGDNPPSSSLAKTLAQAPLGDIAELALAVVQALDAMRGPIVSVSAEAAGKMDSACPTERKRP